MRTSCEPAGGGSLNWFSAETSGQASKFTAFTLSVQVSTFPELPSGKGFVRAPSGVGAGAGGGGGGNAMNVARTVFAVRNVTRHPPWPVHDPDQLPKRQPLAGRAASRNLPPYGA